MDFAVEVERILEDIRLGMRLDVGPDQIGFYLTLRGLPANTDPDSTSLSIEVGQGLCGALNRASCTRHRGIRLIKMDWSEATVRLTVPERSEVAVVIKSPVRGGAADRSSPREMVGDKVLSQLERSIAAESLWFCVVGDNGDEAVKVSVVSAALIVPKRVPREVPATSPPHIDGTPLSFACLSPIMITCSLAILASSVSECLSILFGRYILYTPGTSDSGDTAWTPDR